MPFEVVCVLLEKSLFDVVYQAIFVDEDERDSAAGLLHPDLPMRYRDIYGL